jgi:NIPSNAP.
VQQLRIYEIFEPNKAAFHARFRDDATRIMQRHGFRIVSMWEAKSAEKTEFVYLLDWPDEQTMKAAWTAFMADPEWAEIKRLTSARHGQMVGQIQDRTLRLTDYSPRS